MNTFVKAVDESYKPAGGLVLGREYRVRVHHRANGRHVTRVYGGPVDTHLIEATDTVRIMELTAIEPTHLEFRYPGKVAPGEWTSYQIMNGEVEWVDGAITHLAHAFEVLDVAA